MRSRRQSESNGWGELGMFVLEIVPEEAGLLLFAAFWLLGAVAWVASQLWENVSGG